METITNVSNLVTVAPKEENKMNTIVNETNMNQTAQAVEPINYIEKADEDKVFYEINNMVMDVVAYVLNSENINIRSASMTIESGNDLISAKVAVKKIKRNKEMTMANDIVKPNSILDACAKIDREALEKEMLDDCLHNQYMQEWIPDYEEEKEKERLKELEYESMYQEWLAEYEKKHPSKRYVYTFNEQKRLISNYENDYNRRNYDELFILIVTMLKNGYDFQTIDEKVYSFIKNRQINGVCGCFGCVFGLGSPLDNLQSKFTNTHYVSYNTYEFDLEASDRIRRITYGILDCMNYCKTLKNKDIDRVFGNTFFELQVLECSEHNYYKSGYRLQYYMFGVYLYRTFFENFAYKMRDEIRDYHDFLIDEYFC